MHVAINRELSRIGNSNIGKIDLAFHLAIAHSIFSISVIANSPSVSLNTRSYLTAFTT